MSMQQNNNQSRPAGRPGFGPGSGRGGGPGGFGPGGHGMMRGEKARDFKGTMRKFIQYLGAYKWAILVVMIFAAASTVFTIVGPKILGQATTKLFEGVMSQTPGNGPNIDFAYIANRLLLVLGLYLISAMFAYIQGWIMAGVTAKVTYRFREAIANKINRMPLRYFDGTNHGEVLSRITNDVDTVNQTLNQSLSQIITSGVSVVGTLVMMFSISWIMTLAALLVIPLSVAFTALVIGKSQKYFKQQQEYLGHVNGHVEEMYGGHIVMKAFNGEAKSVETFDQYNTWPRLAASRLVISRPLSSMCATSPSRSPSWPTPRMCSSRPPRQQNASLSSSARLKKNPMPPDRYSCLARQARPVWKARLSSGMSTLATTRTRSSSMTSTPQ
jgi:ABC-type multidrug transport system fused ATPase/permease subunit